MKSRAPVVMISDTRCTLLSRIELHNEPTKRYAHPTSSVFKCHSAKFIELSFTSGVPKKDPWSVIFHKWLSTLEDMARDRCHVALLLQLLNWFTWLVTISDLLISSTSFPDCVMASFLFNLFFFSFPTSDSQKRKKNNNKQTKL